MEDDMEKMFGLTDEENEEYLKTANLAARALSSMIIQSCDNRIRQLNEKSRDAWEAAFPGITKPQ
jgi:hypothetical protein